MKATVISDGVILNGIAVSNGDVVELTPNEFANLARKGKVAEYSEPPPTLPDVTEPEDEPAPVLETRQPKLRRRKLL